MNLTTDSFIYPAVPTQIIFGNGSIARLPEKIKELGSYHVLVVTDSGIAEAGILKKVSDILAAGGLKVFEYQEIPQDSSTRHIGKAVSLLKKLGATSIVGLGGGSSMDAAKAIAVAATNPGSIREYAGLGKVMVNPLPVIAVPTTAGTGSEVSYWSVMTDDKTNVKISVGGEKVFPKVALCDPELTAGLPPYITATTGMDALTHAIESYVNTSHQPISSALTLRAIELAGKYLVRAVRNGTDSEARYGMMLASTLAGLGMNPTRLGLVHALAMPLGSWKIKIAHGAANAVLLPYAMEFNYSSAPEAYADVAVALGMNRNELSTEELAKQSVRMVEEMGKTCHIPAGLGVLGLSEEMIPDVCREAMLSGNIPVNPRKVTVTDLEEICRKAL